MTTPENRESNTGLRSAAIMGSMLLAALGALAGAEWVREQFDLPPLATPAMLIGLGGLSWFIAVSIRPQ